VGCLAIGEPETYAGGLSIACRPGRSQFAGSNTCPLPGGKPRSAGKLTVSFSSMSLRHGELLTRVLFLDRFFFGSGEEPTQRNRAATWRLTPRCSASYSRRLVLAIAIGVASGYNHCVVDCRFDRFEYEPPRPARVIARGPHFLRLSCFLQARSKMRRGNL